MIAWLKNVAEVILWYWIGRPTSRMRREWDERSKRLPPHPKPGRTIL